MLCSHHNCRAADRQVALQGGKEVGTGLDEKIEDIQIMISYNEQAFRSYQSHYKIPISQYVCSM